MSERYLPDSIKTNIGSTHMKPIVLVEMEFPEEPARLWSGRGMLKVGGKEWFGAGKLLNISSISEKTDGTSTNITISLNGLDAALVDKIEFLEYQGNKATIYISSIPSDSGAEIELVPIFSGQMNQDTIVDKPSSVDISIQVGSRLEDLLRTKVMRCTVEDHKLINPTAYDNNGRFDGFFDRVHLMGSLNLDWDIA